MHYRNPLIVGLDRVFDQNSRADFLRLDLNENPRGLSREFIEDVLSNISPEFVSEYPETLGFTQMLAKQMHVGVDNICLTNGSAEAIRHVIEAFTSPAGRILGVAPTYAMFDVYAHMYGREYVAVQYEDDLSLPIENILKRFDVSTQLLILVNPNNPVGNAYSSDEITELVRVATEMGATVLIDEAYSDFMGVSYAATAASSENVLVTRTFSKLFSLAGCRLGYLIAREDNTALVQKLCTPHNVNAFAMLFAERIMETPGMVEQLRERNRQGKETLRELLSTHGYKFHVDQGNFMFIQPRTNAVKLVRRLKEAEGILVKSYPKVGDLGTCLRVTVGDMDIMERFFEALLKLDR